MGMKSNCNDDDENFDMVSAKQSKQYDLMPKDRILDIIEDWIVVVDPLQEDTLKSEKILDPILLDRILVYTTILAFLREILSQDQVCL